MLPIRSTPIGSDSRLSRTCAAGQFVGPAKHDVELRRPHVFTALDHDELLAIQRDVVGRTGGLDGVLQFEERRWFAGTERWTSVDINDHQYVATDVKELSAASGPDRQASATGGNRPLPGA